VRGRCGLDAGEELSHGLDEHNPPSRTTTRHWKWEEAEAEAVSFDPDPWRYDACIC
jgi:hypothetical protein